MKQIIKIWLGLFVLALIGCGGGGGGGSSSGTAGSFFITDDLTTGYDHVWVTIKQVTLGKVGGGSTTVFQDTEGISVDLRSLRDAQGRRFKFIGRDNHLSGQYESVTVTLDDDVVLFTTGSSTGLNRTFEGSVNGDKTLTANFAARTFGPGNDDLIIDFDLSQWNDNGTQVTGAAIAVVVDNSLGNQDRHDRENYPGTVSNLQGTAPNQTFTLTRGTHSVTIQTSADTRIHRSGEGNGNPVLANGQHVVVRGMFDISTNMLNAERIRITGNSGNDDDEDEAFGVVSNINAGAGTLDLSASSVEGFLPTGDPIHITTNGQTTYRSGSGAQVTKDEFFALLTAETTIEAEGTYDAGTNTLLAAKLKIEDGPGDDEDNAEVTGATSIVNLDLFTFKVTATEFSGINVPPGTQIQVVTTAETKFKSHGDLITRLAFFTAINGTPGMPVEVEGHWDGSVLTAFKCNLEGEDD